MSQPPQIPPPIPVPFAEPVPMAAESFAPLPPRRPGVVTTLGIMSIVFAIVEVGWTLMLGVIVLMFVVVATVTGAVNYTRGHQYTGGVYYPDGLTAYQTTLLENHLNELGTLSPARQAALDAMLTKNGRTIAPTLLTGDQTPDALAKTIETLVTDHGKTAEGNDYFELREGRIEVMDDRATFEPEGTTQIIVVTVAEMQAATQSAEVEPEPPVAATQPGVKPRESLVAFAVIMGVMSAAWAILLFVAGICALRGRRMAGTMHRVWAWTRLPLAVLGTIATAMFFGSFPEADRTATAPVDPVDVIGWMILGSIPGVIAVTYAIVVLLMVRTKSAKAWFARS